MSAGHPAARICEHGRQLSICAVCAPAADAAYSASRSSAPGDETEANSFATNAPPPEIRAAPSEVPTPALPVPAQEAEALVDGVVAWALACHCIGGTHVPYCQLPQRRADLLARLRSPSEIPEAPPGDSLGMILETVDAKYARETLRSCNELERNLKNQFQAVRLEEEVPWMIARLRRHAGGDLEVIGRALSPEVRQVRELVQFHRSESCEGERCTMCGKPATMKVGEEIAHDDPFPNRHNFTAYVCLECGNRILCPYVFASRSPEETPDATLPVFGMPLDENHPLALEAGEPRVIEHPFGIASTPDSSRSDTETPSITGTPNG